MAADPAPRPGAAGIGMPGPRPPLASLPQRLGRESGRIAVSLMLGLLIWFIARNRTYELIQIPATVRPANVPENVEVECRRTVDLRVSLPVNLRDLVGPGDFEIPVDLADVALRAGVDAFATFEVPLLPEDVQPVGDRPFGPEEVVPQAINPRTLTVRARFIAAPFPLRLRLVGKPPEGLHIEAQEVSPALVWLSAPRAALDRAVREQMVLWTAPIEIAALSAQRHTFAPTLDVPEGFTVVAYQETSDSAVIPVRDGVIPAAERWAVITVAENRTERIVEGVGGTLPLLRRDLVITDQEPRLFRVRISGPASVIAALTPADFTVTAPELLNFDHAVDGLQVRVEAALSRSQPDAVRQAVQILGVEPNRATVTIETAPAVSPASAGTAPVTPAPLAPLTPSIASPAFTLTPTALSPEP